VYVIGGDDAAGDHLSTIEMGTFTAAPVMSITASKTTFRDTGIGTASELYFDIQNTGNANLYLTYSLTDDTTDFQAFREPPVIPAGSSANLRIRFIPTALGVMSASMTINSSAPANPSVTINLSGKGVPIPQQSGGTSQDLDDMSISGAQPSTIAIHDGR